MGNAYRAGRCACPPQGRATIATQGMCGVVRCSFDIGGKVWYISCKSDYRK